MFVRKNENPKGKNVGDCTVRAVSLALDQDWDETYMGLALEGFVMGDMPSANAVWGAYLKRKGFHREVVPDHDFYYTVADFANDHAEGTFVLALSGHVVCVKDGNWMDSWDSGHEIPLYYWRKDE